MTPVCPTDKILVTLDKKYKDSTGTGLYIDPTFRPGHYATVTGKVISVPHKLSSHPQKRVINMEVKPGDDLAFAYHVVYNHAATDNATEVYYEDPPNNPWVTEWSNDAGMRLVRFNKGGGKFEGYLYHLKGEKAGLKPEVVEMVKGSVSEVNDFIDRHKKSANTFIEHRNQLWLGEEDYWKVDYHQAYMVRRGNEFVMIGGYVLLEYKKVERNEYTGNLELWGDGRKDIKPELRTKVIAIGTPLKVKPTLSCKAGDTVIVDQRTVQEYNFWGNDYLLARQDQILAKV